MNLHYSCNKSGLCWSNHDTTTSILAPIGAQFQFAVKPRCENMVIFFSNSACSLLPLQSPMKSDNSSRQNHLSKFDSTIAIGVFVKGIDIQKGILIQLKRNTVWNLWCHYCYLSVKSILAWFLYIKYFQIDPFTITDTLS